MAVNNNRSFENALAEMNSLVHEAAQEITTMLCAAELALDKDASCESRQADIKIIQGEALALRDTFRQMRTQLNYLQLQNEFRQN